MELEIISMTPQERMYSYSQSSQIEAQTGCIGHLRGDFGAGQEFFTSWFDHRGEYKTDEFKAEFDEVVNSLREKDGLLFSRDSMTRYCQQRPEAEMVGNYCTEYGFKLKTDHHTYMLRCNPNYGDYNFYLYAYVGRFLEHHMEKAKQGIRFITPGYKEIFRIPDGDMVLAYDGMSNEYRITLKGTLSHTVTLGADVFGNITRLDNALENLAGNLDAERAKLEEAKVQLENARTELTTPFAREEELTEKTARLKELNILLNMDEKDKTLIDESPDEGEEPPARKVVGLER